MERLAERLLNATGRLFKSAMMVAVALLGLFVAILALMSANQYFTQTLPSRQVKVTEFALADRRCFEDGTDSLLVRFQNQSSRTVVAITFSIEANNRGRSTNIAEPNQHRDDKVLKPGDSYFGCWPRPRLTGTEYLVKASNGQEYVVTWHEGEASDADIRSAIKEKFHRDGVPLTETEGISFVITKNVNYHLRKTSVEFQD